MENETKEKRATFMERINQDWWHDDLWLELNDACNDSGDAGAVKDLNKLAMRWEHLSEEKREHMNEAFIIICGWSFDSLLAKVDGREE
tara:strand:+ start:530 stop:793 length:264 start_codon:yes stop_codon:yes gene_type:complete